MLFRLCLIIAVPFAAPSAMAQEPTSRSPFTTEQVVEMMDTNKDGTISKAEWQAAGRRGQQFAKIDANANEKISADVLKAAIDRRKAGKRAPVTQ